MVKAFPRRKSIDMELFYLTLFVVLVVIGWLFDMNGIFLSKYFNLAGITLVPVCGMAIAALIHAGFKRK
ncbi:MAG: DUF3925 family protein [Bacillaceae bacterium]